MAKKATNLSYATDHSKREFETKRASGCRLQGMALFVLPTCAFFIQTEE
jgi:hypothetical protein